MPLTSDDDDDGNEDSNVRIDRHRCNDDDDDIDDDSADEEDSSDEAAIAQAGHLGAALGGFLSLDNVTSGMPGARGGDDIDESEPWAKVSLSYTTSAAPSDRGKCKACGQAIAQGSLVVAERQGGGYCHFGCKDFFKEVTDACVTARAGPSQELFVPRPVAAAEGAGSSEQERQVALTIAVDVESRSDRITVCVHDHAAPRVVLCWGFDFG